MRTHLFIILLLALSLSLLYLASTLFSVCGKSKLRSNFIAREKKSQKNDFYQLNYLIFRLIIILFHRRLSTNNFWLPTQFFTHTHTQHHVTLYCHSFFNSFLFYLFLFFFESVTLHTHTQTINKKLKNTNFKKKYYMNHGDNHHHHHVEHVYAYIYKKNCNTCGNINFVLMHQKIII